MNALRFGAAALLFLWAVPATQAETKVWQDTITLPTWLEGPPETSPRIDSLDPDRSKYYQANYPYPTRSNFVNKQEPQPWRRLNLENEYLACSFLPDLGGHLYTCIDKLNGRPIFRGNPSIKKANIGVRGAWVALGIEWNFPVAHSRDTTSPVNFSFRQEKDRAEIWVGDIDRATGMEWLVEFVLRDGSAVLEENVTLRNSTAIRHPYLWWANSDIVSDAGTRFVYPVRVMSAPGLTELLPWPLDKHGVDLSNPANNKDSLAVFGYGSREPFMAVYNTVSRTAAIHVADPAVVTGKKIWIWGTKGQSEIRAQLSDDNAAYVEMQAGLFMNQETYQHLQPHGQVQFSELWLAGRNLSGVTRANRHAVLGFERQNTAGKRALALELNVTHAIPGAHIRVWNGLTDAAVVLDEKADLTPSRNYAHSIAGPEKGPYRFELRDGAGALLMAHTEGIYETVGPANVTLGPQPPHMPAARETAADFAAIGEYDEENSRFQLAEGEYRAGMAKFPKDVRLMKALGRLLVERQRYAEGVERLSQAAAVWQADPELRYYLGVALWRSGKEDDARKSWTMAASDARETRFGPAALVEMAESESRAGNSASALDLAAKAIVRSQDSLTARKLQVALLRRGGKLDDARKQLEEARAIDPLDSFLRLEGSQLGVKDDSLWMHLGADPARVLDIAGAYFDFGMYPDALQVLEHTYAAVPANQSEPGAVLPQDDPLVAYYRGYCRQKLGQSGAGDFKLASSQRLEYVFPNRADAAAALQAAIRENAQDASAHFLLGLAYLNDNSSGDAIAELQAARAIRKDIPELHFALARALLLTKEGKGAAVSVLNEGLAARPSDAELKDLMAEATAPPKRPPAPQPAASTSGPAYPGGVKPGTPIEMAEYLLSRAASGDIAAFDWADFQQEKQAGEVRQVYIELQLQRLRRLMAERKCSEALHGVETVGDEEPSLPFTLYGFDEWMKGARFQYYLGAVEAGCGDQKAARRRWAKVAKLTAAVDSPDVAFPLVAAQNLASKGQGPDLKPALQKVTEALESAEAGSNIKGILLYSKGILLLASGEESSAFDAFQQGAGTSDRGMAHYLNTLALHEAHKN